MWKPAPAKWMTGRTHFRGHFMTAQDGAARAAAVDLIFGRWRSQILHAGIKLGIIEAMGEEAASAAGIADELALDADATYRLMRAMGSIGVLAEDADRRFRLTPVGAFFRADHPATMRGIALLEEGPEHVAVWHHLPDLVREGETGRNGFVREYGHPVFAHVAGDADYRAVFNDAMSSYSASQTAMVLAALEGCDLSGISHICDIGGGHGHLLAHLLAARPGLRGTVLDLPQTVADSKSHWAGKIGVDDRCRYEGGDMFAAVPAADAYILKLIFHDWGDADCIRILESIHRAAPAGARVFVAEFIVPGPDEPHFSKLFDIHMMCVVSGRERTEDEYADLFARAGWRHAATWHPPEGDFGVIEAVKATGDTARPPS